MAKKFKKLTRTQRMRLDFLLEFVKESDIETKWQLVKDYYEIARDDAFNMDKRNEILDELERKDPKKRKRDALERMLQRAYDELSDWNRSYKKLCIHFENSDEGYIKRILYYWIDTYPDPAFFNDDVQSWNDWTAEQLQSVIDKRATKGNGRWWIYYKGTPIRISLPAVDRIICEEAIEEYKEKAMSSPAIDNSILYTVGDVKITTTGIRFRKKYPTYGSFKEVGYFLGEYHFQVKNMCMQRVKKRNKKAVFPIYLGNNKKYRKSKRKIVQKRACTYPLTGIYELRNSKQIQESNVWKYYLNLIDLFVTNCFKEEGKNTEDKVREIYFAEKIKIVSDEEISKKYYISTSDIQKIIDREGEEHGNPAKKTYHYETGMYLVIKGVFFDMIVVRMPSTTQSAKLIQIWNQGLCEEFR